MRLLYPLGASKMNTTIEYPGSSAFVRGVMNFLRKVEYRRCDRGEDYEAICRLRYQAYHSSGILDAPAQSSIDRRISDELDDEPNCFNFGVFVDEHLISTMRLHYLSAATPNGPSSTAYPDLVLPRIEAGERFIDPSRFASDPSWAGEFPEIPYVTIRLAIMASIYHEVPYCLTTIRPNHAAFYRRNFGSRQIGGLRSYPEVNCQISMWEADVGKFCAETLPKRSFFDSTELERRLTFNRPNIGETAPLTILPSLSALQLAA